MGDWKVGSGIRSWSTGTLVAAGIALLCVGLLVGFGVGVKAEEHRVQSKAKTRVSQRAKTKTPATPKVKTPLPAFSVTGKVTAVGSTGVTITPPKGAPRRVLESKATRVLKVTTATMRDLAVGSRVLYAGKDSLAVAREVVVLPPTPARMGALVTAANATSMTLESDTKSFTVSVRGARLEKAITGSNFDITHGATVIAHAQSAKQGVFVATEVIVLPTGTTFP